MVTWCNISRWWLKLMGKSGMRSVTDCHERKQLLGEPGLSGQGRSSVSVSTPNYSSALYSHFIAQRLHLVRPLIAERWTLHRPYLIVVLAEFDMIAEIFFFRNILELLLLLRLLGQLFIRRSFKETKNSMHCSSCVIVMLILQMWKLR